ncbi:MAG: hypothetical protein GKC10_01595 [Methanosarcinales archaeon]|nr:hypothetical protein [Methanosarcinales archaeon]
MKKDEHSPGEAEIAVKRLARELCRRYVHQIVKESTKRALKDRGQKLSDKKLSKLERELKELSDEQKLQKFDKSLEKAAREIESGRDGNVDVTEKVSEILEEPLRGSLLMKAVKLSTAVVVPVAVVVVAYSLLLPLLAVSPDPLHLSFDLPVEGRGSHWIYISNQRGGDLEWQARSDQPWISLSIGRGRSGRGETVSVRVSVDARGLEAGRHIGQIVITSNGGEMTGRVVLNLFEEPSLSVNPDPPSYEVSLEAGTRRSESLQIENSGTGNLRWTASSDQPWLEIRPRSGTHDQTATIAIDARDLDPGDYRGTVTIDSNGGSREAAVHLTVTRPPRLQVDRENMTFDFQQMRLFGSTPIQPEPQRFTISNAGDGVLSWSIESDQPWLTVSPGRGTNRETVSVFVNTEMLEDDASGSFVISSNGGSRRGTVNVNIGYMAMLASRAPEVR